MTTDIRTTIVDALALKFDVSVDAIEADNGHHITAAAEALVEREYEIAERLVDFGLQATEFDKESIENFVANAGLSVRPQPEPEPEEEPVVEELPAEPGSYEQRIANLEAGQAQIIKSLGILTTLAETHLGSSAL